MSLGTMFIKLEWCLLPARRLMDDVVLPSFLSSFLPSFLPSFRVASLFALIVRSEDTAGVLSRLSLFLHRKILSNCLGVIITQPDKGGVV